MIQVLVVDDHKLVRTGICHMLDAVKEVEVVGEAGTGQEAITMVRDLAPDVVLLDIVLPDFSGVHVAENNEHIFKYGRRERIITLVIILARFGENS